MPQDHEDGTVPTIIMRADMTLCVDITAQTIGNIGIDIKAQTLGQLNINIAASAVKLAITINAADITGNIPIDIKTQTLGQVNINIKAQTLAQLNVNIAASAVTVNVNISSQSGNINVNLAASAATVNVNISSQSGNINVNLAASAATVTVSVTGTANISITAQSVGIYLKPDWELIQNHDKFFYADGVTAVDAEQHDTYAVPAVKTLYITNMTVCIFGTAVADRDDKHHNFAAYIAYNGTWLEEVGGDGGGSWHFDIPIEIPGGNDVSMFCYNRSNHQCNIYVTARGYEL